MSMFIELGGVINGYFTRNKIYSQTQANEAINKLRQLGNNKDIYYCTYMFDNQTRDNTTKYISPLYFDIDGKITSEGEFKEVKTALLSLIAFLTMDLRIKSHEIKVYFSGGKGFHVFVNPGVLNIMPSSYLHMAYKIIAMHISKKIEYGNLLDTKIYDCKRLIRVPNSINNKTGYYKIPIPLQDILNLSLSELLKKAQSPQLEYISSNEKNADASTKFFKLLKQEYQKQQRAIEFHRNIKIDKEETQLPLCIKEVLTTPVQKGNRNNTLVILASTLIQHGYIGDKTINTLYMWNAMNNPPLPEKEIISAYNSAEKMALAGRGYGCSAILKYCDFNNSICQSCKVFQLKQNRQGG